MSDSDNAYEAEPTFSTPVRLCDGTLLNDPAVVTIDGKETWMIVPYTSSWIAQQDPTVTSETMGPTVYTFSLGSDGVPKAEFYSRIMENPYEKISTFRNYCEPMLAQTPDGKLMMTVRTDKGLEAVWTKEQPTAGPYTGGWTELENLKDGSAVMSRTASRTTLRRLSDGSLLLLYHNNPNGARTNMTAALSQDGGKTWPYKLLLDERAVSYQDIAVDDATNTIYVQYDNDRYGLMELLISRITVDDIKAGRMTSAGSYRNKLINDNDYNKPVENYTQNAVLLESPVKMFGVNANNGYQYYTTEAGRTFISFADDTLSVTSCGEEGTSGNATGFAFLTNTDSNKQNYIDSGMSIEKGAVVFDLYVSDKTAFVGRNVTGYVYLGDNNGWIGASMGNQLCWNIKNMVYQDGWNEVWLNLRDATGAKDAIDLSHIGGLWLYNTRVPAGVEIKVKNIRFVEAAESGGARCTHRKCATCGGCMMENCLCPIDSCCTKKCDGPHYKTTYTIPIPAGDNTSWVTGGRWCAATNGSKTWGSANTVKNAEGTILTHAENGTLTLTVGQDAAGGSGNTSGLLFLTNQANGVKSGVSAENGRLVLDVYIYDADAFKTNGGKIEIADINVKNNVWINDGNRLSWSGDALGELKQGWNTLYLNLADAVFTANSGTASQTFDLDKLGYVWIFTTKIPDGEQIAVRNVHFQEKQPQ